MRALTTPKTAGNHQCQSPKRGRSSRSTRNKPGWVHEHMSSEHLGQHELNYSRKIDSADHQMPQTPAAALLQTIMRRPCMQISRNQSNGLAKYVEYQCNPSCVERQQLNAAQASRNVIWCGSHPITKIAKQTGCTDASQPYMSHSAASSPG